jgi:hypothetical protein
LLLSGLMSIVEYLMNHLLLGWFNNFWYYWSIFALN